MAYSKKKIKSEYGTFIQQYARKKSRNGYDPNDRSYSRKLEEKLKRMRPEDIQALLDEDD